MFKILSPLVSFSTSLRLCVKSFLIICLVGAFLLSGQAHAGFTETLPKGTFLLEEGFMHAALDNAWDNDGNLGPIIEEIERYEPGGSLQGIIRPKVEASYDILVNLLQYGILDDLALAVAVPVVLNTQVKPNLEWEEGDYQWTLGRPYSEEDFWEWAESMGQPRPGNWSGNQGTLTDMVIGLRYRFTDRFSWFERHELACAVTILGALPTGSAPDPEEVVTAGTTAWNLHFQGELGIHLSVDKFFRSALDDRLTLGLDLFYETFFRREYTTSVGTKHPLLLNYQPYAGDTYTIDPGDFAGASCQIDFVPWKGPARATWLSKGSPESAASFPPLLTLTLRYTFTHLNQSDWESDSELWDWSNEKYWRPGYKNALQGMALFSFLRLGLPLQLYASYRNQTWIPGKNFRAANVLSAGIRIPAKFW